MFKLLSHLRAVQPAETRFLRQLGSSLRLLLLTGVLLLVSGCTLFRSTQPAQIDLNLNAFLPPEWQPLEALHEINIDGDDAVEYLMFYTYDQAGGSGPVGALVLDPQAESVVTAGNVRLAGRPAGFPNPYAILPSYWEGAGQGFIAAPNQQDALDTQQVNYGGGSNQTSKPDTLVLRGGNTYLTFAWWRNVIDGYGVTQLYAPGGFEGIDWAAWDRAPAPILSVVAVAPRNDRNLFCQKTRYDLAEPGEPVPADYQPGIRFRATDLGLFFCFGPPTHPFYAEGVVLAYLRHPELRTGLLTPALAADANAQTQMAQMVGLDSLVRVDEVLGYRDIPVPEVNTDVPSPQPVTTVCAQVVLDSGGQPERRWLLFTLEYQPPLLDPPTPDRLYIANVNAIPAPSEGAGLRCEQLIEPK